MPKKTTTLVLLLLLIVGCKNDSKKTAIPTPEDTAKKTLKLQKAYHFFSKIEDLKILYQSDAWHMMLEDAKKIGLQQIQVAQLDSSYFIHYTLLNTKATIFNQLMDALPTFKNFQEMSKSLTGTPLNYHKELTPIFEFTKNTLQTDSSYKTILYLEMNTEIEKTFPLELFQKYPLQKFRAYLEKNTISNIEMYHQNNRIYTVIHASEVSKIQEIQKKLHWNQILDEQTIEQIKKQYPKLNINHLIFENWQEMSLL